MAKARCKTCGAEGPPWNHVASSFDPDGIGDPGHRVTDTPKTPDPNMADSPPLTPEDELDIILTTFNNRIRREPRLKDPDAIVRDFIENHAETLAKLKAREARIRIDELNSLDHNKQMFGDWQQVIADRIAQLKNSLMPDDIREHNEYDSLFTSALMKYHHHDWTMEMIREAALICSNTLPPDETI